MSNEAQFVTVKVFRFDPAADSKPHYDTFQVAYDEGETVLGVLKSIAKYHDPGLAFRESCRIGNCAICHVKVNGKPVIACRKTLKEFETRELVLDPFNEARVIRDLVCLM